MKATWTIQKPQPPVIKVEQTLCVKESDYKLCRPVKEEDWPHIAAIIPAHYLPEAIAGRVKELEEQLATALRTSESEKKRADENFDTASRLSPMLAKAQQDVASMRQQNNELHLNCDSLRQQNEALIASQPASGILFKLTDNANPMTITKWPAIECAARILNGRLCVYVNGYGNAHVTDGLLLGLQVYEGKLELVYWPDYASEEVSAVSMEGAKIP